MGPLDLFKELLRRTVGPYSVEEVPSLPGAHGAARIPLVGRPRIRIAAGSPPRTLAHELAHVEQKRRNPLRYYLDRRVRRGSLVDPVEQEAEAAARYYERVLQAARNRGLPAPQMEQVMRAYMAGQAR